MTPSRAKEVLEFMNVNISIAELRKGTSLYVDSFNSHAMLNGAFHPDQLQAIALWMQDPESVVNAESAEGWKQVTNYIKTGASK